MNYSKEEIERKRLMALQRKQQAQSKAHNSSNTNNYKGNVFPVVNNVNLNGNRQNYGNNLQRTSTTFGTSTHKSPCVSVVGGSRYNKPTKRFNPIEPKTFFGQKPNITATCYMITDDRFTLETSSFFPPLIETLKTIPSKAYDMKSKTWNFHIRDYENLIEKMGELKSDVHIVGLPKPVLQMFRKRPSSEYDIPSTDLSRIDPRLVESLMPFQRDGICYGISKGGRCMIADDMGLGKTIQALGIAHYYRESWPLLIIAPSSVRYQWSEAIYTFLPSIPAQYIHQFTSAKDFVDTDKVVITSYDLLVRAIDNFEKRVFGFVILDESHVLKTIKTARHKAVQRVISQARHVVLLTGTPALSRPIELYSQINLVTPNFMRYEEYGVRYCAGKKNAFGWDFTGSSNLTELQMLLKHCCMIRRLKSEVLNQLPTKRREVIVLDPRLIKMGTDEMTEMSNKLERKTLSGIEKHNALLEYYIKSSVAKQRAICDYVTRLFKDKKKCLIYAHHQNILDAICEVAESMNIKYIRIDGKTNPERRKYQVDKFQKSDDYLAAILSITAANAGITLTAAQLVVFAELFWNPGILCQAEDRVHRIGQDDNVVIQYLVAKQTVDDYLWPLIQRKINVLNEAGLDHEFSFSDARVTKQGQDKKQTTLNSFIIEEHKEDIPNEQVVQSTTVENNFSTTTEEFKELLDINEEDFECYDWEDIA